MKRRIMMMVFITSLCSLTANAQQKEPKKAKSNKEQGQRQMPAWGQSSNYQNDKYVYFPDYYTFYSPDRGYITWNNGSWSNSMDMPSNMTNADMRSIRTQTLDDPLNSYPERSFSNYSTQYPAQPVNGTVLPAPQVR